MNKTFPKDSSTTLVAEDITQGRHMVHDDISIIKARISACS